MLYVHCVTVHMITQVTLKSEKLCEVPFENPCINPKYGGSKYNFLWAMGPDPEGTDKGFVRVFGFSSLCFSYSLTFFPI